MSNDDLGQRIDEMLVRWVALRGALDPGRDRDGMPLCCICGVGPEHLQHQVHGLFAHRDCVGES